MESVPARKGRRPAHGALVFLSIVLAAASVVSGGTLSPATAATPPAPVPANTYTWWNWPAAPSGGWSHVSREVDLTVVTDPGPSSLSFFAYQFSFGGGLGGYLGLQTVGGTSASPGAPSGKIAIFSVFGACDDNAPTPGCPANLLGLGGGTRPELLSSSFCLALTDKAGGAPEGSGASCRVPFAWRAGVRYRLRLTAVGGQWWRATVVNTATQQETGIGQIRVPDGWRGLNGVDVSWIEYYGVTSHLGEACQNLSVARVRWEGAKGLQPGASTPVAASSASSHLSTVARACPNSSVTPLGAPLVGALQQMGGTTP